MDYVAENAVARERVLGLARGLSDEALSRPVGGDWTIGAELAHLAFWDRVHVGRLRAAIDQGLAAPPPLPDGLTDIINNGELGTWRRLPGRDAIEIFESASRDVDEYVATLDPVIVEGVRAAGMSRLVERFRHRLEHADEIERSL
jgi:DinB superfamily